MNSLTKFPNLSEETNVLVNQLSEKFELSSIRFVDERFNAVFSGTSNSCGQVIIRIGSGSYRKDFSEIISPEICGYFDPNKHNKEEKLISIANKAKIPTPTIIDHGFVDNIPWCIETKVAGYSMEGVLHDLKSVIKIKLLNDIGHLLAMLHSQESLSDENIVAKYWERKISVVTSNLLVLNVFSLEQIKKIKHTLNKLKNKMFEVNRGLVGPVHMEIIPKHIFINGNYSITGIIDWETGEIIGDTFCDIASTAYWLSGKGIYSNGSLALTNEKEFNSILDGYGSVIPIDKNGVLDSIPFYDLMWLLNILWVKTFQDKPSFIESRKELVSHIVENFSK